MTTEMNKNNITNNRSTRHASLLIWIMLILLPAIGAKVIFFAAMEMETSLMNSTQRQKLVVELQKYTASLRGIDFIYSALQLSEIHEAASRLYRGREFSELLRSHFILRQIPVTASPNEQVEAISTLVSEQIGVKPDVVCLMAEKPEQCAWILKAPLRHHCSEEEFKIDLSRGHADYQQAIRSEIAGENCHQLLNSAQHLFRAISTFEPIDSGLSYLGEQFCRELNGCIFVWSMPVITSSGALNFVLMGVAESALDPLFMLRTTTERLSSNNFKHTIGHSKITSFPVFDEQNGRLSIVGDLPETFRPHAIKMKHSDKLKPAIRISCDSAYIAAHKKQVSANALILLYAMLATFSMTGIYLGKFKLSARLNQMVVAGFFAGILLPMSGAIWLGICYLNTQKHLHAESILDFMQEKITEKEQAIKLQICRNVLFQNIISSRVARFSDKSLLKFNYRTGFADWATNKPADRIPFYLHQRFYAYTFIKPELEDYTGVSSFRTQKTDTVQLFFSGAARETLNQLGAFSHLPEDYVRPMLQKSQLTMGILDTAMDNRVITRTFAEDQAPVTNTITTGLAFVTGIFWKNQDNRTTGLSLFQTDRQAWKGDIDRMLEIGMINHIYVRDGFEISLHLFNVHPTRSGILNPDMFQSEPIYSGTPQYFWELAQAVFALTDDIRMNNLNEKRAHLIKTSVAADRQVMIMAYAAPLPVKWHVSDELFLGLLAIFAILSSYVSAKGIAWALLRSIPPFQTAIKRLNQQDYSWKLVLESGDEFDSLASSFNTMTIKLHEKEKLSRLVSRNVLDAISSGNEELLKPGGSRVKASILFADIRGFTTITESNPPQMVVEMLNDYFTLMAEKIEKHGGIIDKLIGDAIQAVFYDHECENCALSAVQAAREMRQALPAFNAERSKKNLFNVDNGVGICTGTVICGRVGSEHGKLDATIIGNLVNQAARLESLSKYGKSTKIAIDEGTAEALPKQFSWRIIVTENEASIRELIR